MFNLKRLMLLSGGSIVAITLACFVIVKFASADILIPWLEPSSLALQKQADLSVVQPSINGNIDCSAEAESVCAVDTLYGTVNTAGGVRLNQTSSYSPVVSYVDSRQHFIGVPNSSTFITYTTEPAIGFYLYF